MMTRKIKLVEMAMKLRKCLDSNPQEDSKELTILREPDQSQLSLRRENLKGMMKMTLQGVELKKGNSQRRKKIQIEELREKIWRHHSITCLFIKKKLLIIKYSNF